ncbi:uncharacterized protein [Amphiura filiformis]|uniref:uncharacterized protein n=1 Tax=Amphiura filiformis TaxID=82378 RepID=UPI003B21B7E0
MDFWLKPWCAVCTAVVSVFVFYSRSAKAAYRSRSGSYSYYRYSYYSYNNYYNYYGYSSGTRLAVSWWVILLIFIGLAVGLTLLIFLCKKHQRGRVRVTSVQTTTATSGQPKRTRPIRTRPQPPGQYPLHQYPNSAWSSSSGYPPPPPTYDQVSTISYPQGPPPAYPAASAPTATGIAAPLPPPYPAYGCPTSMPEPTDTSYGGSSTRNQHAQPSAPGID